MPVFCPLSRVRFLWRNRIPRPSCLPLADHATHLAEPGALRQEHNMSPDIVIEAAARALRCVVPVRHWDRGLLHHDAVIARQSKTMSKRLLRQCGSVALEI